MAFDREGSWTVSNDFARNVVIFGVDYSSLFHTYNRKNTFLVLVELMVVFQKIFWSVSEDIIKEEDSEISLNGTVYDLSVEHCSIEKEDMLNIPEYLMIKNNIKQSLDLSKNIYWIIN